MAYYTYKQVDQLISNYQAKGGEAVCLDEGVLASGDWILHDPSGKLYNFVIKEVYLNEWSSAQTIRRYKKLPKKYEEMFYKAIDC